jgi:hypothetical protein
VPARSHSVGAPSPSGASRPQIQIGKPTLPEHRAVASQAGDGDRERLLQASKTGEGRAPVRSAQLEPGDGCTAVVPADDLPGEGVGPGRPGDSQLITSRPNNPESIPTRTSGTAPGAAGSARLPVTAACWLSAHAEASDPSDDPSPAAASSAVVPPIGPALCKKRHFNALPESRLLARGITRAPAFVRDFGVGPLGTAAGLFATDVYLGDRPPLLSDFLDDEVAADVDVPAVQKMIVVHAIELTPLA